MSLEDALIRRQCPLCQGRTLAYKRDTINTSQSLWLFNLALVLAHSFESSVLRGI